MSIPSKKRMIVMAISLIVVMPIIIDYCHLAYPSNDTPNMSFMNNPSKTQMYRGIGEAFPPGTPKHYVERALVEKAGAEYSGQIEATSGYPLEHNVHTYHYQKPIYLRFLHNGSYVIAVFYDENDRVKKEVRTVDGRTMEGITISGPTGL